MRHIGDLLDGIRLIRAESPDIWTDADEAALQVRRFFVRCAVCAASFLAPFAVFAASPCPVLCLLPCCVRLPVCRWLCFLRGR